MEFLVSFSFCSKDAFNSAAVVAPGWEKEIETRKRRKIVEKRNFMGVHF
jgi:hypothetical protein